MLIVRTKSDNTESTVQTPLCAKPLPSPAPIHTWSCDGPLRDNYGKQL